MTCRKCNFKGEVVYIKYNDEHEKSFSNSDLPYIYMCNALNQINKSHPYLEPWNHFAKT